MKLRKIRKRAQSSLMWKNQNIKEEVILRRNIMGQGGHRHRNSYQKAKMLIVENVNRKMATQIT